MRTRWYCVDCNTMHMRLVGGPREGDPCRKCAGRCQQTTRVAGGQPDSDGRVHLIQIRVTDRVRRLLETRGPSYSRAASDLLETHLL